MRHIVREGGYSTTRRLAATIFADRPIGYLAILLLSGQTKPKTKTNQQQVQPEKDFIPLCLPARTGLRSSFPYRNRRGPDGEQLAAGALPPGGPSSTAWAWSGTGQFLPVARRKGQRTHHDTGNKSEFKSFPKSNGGILKLDPQTTGLKSHKSNENYREHSLKCLKIAKLAK